MNRRDVLKGLLSAPFISLIPKIEPDIFKGIRETRPIRTKLYEANNKWIEGHYVNIPTYPVEVVGYRKIDREEIMELGRRGPYFRQVEFSPEISKEIA